MRADYSESAHIRQTFILHLRHGNPLKYLERCAYPHSPVILWLGIAFLGCQSVTIVFVKNVEFHVDGGL